MTKVQVGEHRWVNVKRRSLCDNCVADVCVRREESRQTRIFQCDMFRSPFVAFKRCTRCGSIFEVFSNFHSLDYEMCQKCNGK
ncbi:MAG: hypothetical protein WC375_00745 [Methanomassiliicoccales archaeon]|jgi:hypothetical protein